MGYFSTSLKRKYIAQHLLMLGGAALAHRLTCGAAMWSSSHLLSPAILNWCPEATLATRIGKSPRRVGGSNMEDIRSGGEMDLLASEDIAQSPPFYSLAGQKAPMGSDALEHE